MDFNYQQHISRLVVRYLKGELSACEMQELEGWREASGRHEVIFQRMISSSHLEDSVGRFVKSGEEQEAEWQRIRHRTVMKERKVWKKVMRYAALWMLLLLVGGGILYIINRAGEKSEPDSLAFVPGSSYAILELGNGVCIDLNNTARHMDVREKNWEVQHDSLKYTGQPAMKEYHTLRVPRGGEYTLVLADGTKVFLNAESCLKYPVYFSGDFRNVKLEGEAYFEVKHNPAKPFIVEVNQLQVKVLGTSFGVRAYAGEDNIHTTLVAGRVNVLTGGKEFSLSPSEQAVYNKRLKTIAVASVETELFVGWKDGRLVFNNCPLEQILKDLGRWYSFEVFYSNSAAKEIPFSLNIRKHESFSQVLDLMQSTGKIQFEINKNTVIVR